MFKRRKSAKTGFDAPASAVAQPMLRETQRPAEVKGALPRFHATASDQLSARSSDRFAAMRARLRHAFTPSQPVADRRMFAGRDEILKTIIRAIEDQRLHIVLYGERGIGKTSLLHMLTQAATEARYIVVYSSCGANSTFAETFSAAAADIPLLFHSGFSPTTVEAEKGASLADLLPAGALTPKKFGDMCAKLTGTRVLIILDEFDRCESGAFRRDVAELIKNLSDRLGRVQLVLAGVAADLTELVEHIPSIRRNIFALRVPKMTDAEILQIVANGEREAGLVFDPRAREFIIEVAQGSPYIANLLCHHAGHGALDKASSTVEAQDVIGAVEQIAKEFQGRISKPLQEHVARLRKQGHGDALVLAARASLAGDENFRVADIVLVNSVTAALAQKAVGHLLTEGLIKLAPTEDGAEPSYLFAEDGLPMLLWVSWAQQAIPAKGGTSPAMSPADATAAP